MYVQSVHLPVSYIPIECTIVPSFLFLAWHTSMYIRSYLAWFLARQSDSSISTTVTFFRLEFDFQIIIKNMRLSILFITTTCCWLAHAPLLVTLFSFRRYRSAPKQVESRVEPLLGLLSRYHTGTSKETSVSSTETTSFVHPSDSLIRKRFSPLAVPLLDSE
jgi:hypothetical protein